ncbi:acetyl-CoA carboxylase carboxyltransferase subunit beta [bacterium]|nr:acetyl-CoA carboxylase carboxyltransferase subunit beta [bacterium]
MAWFNKIAKGIQQQKPKEIPDGLWLKCESCQEIIYRKELEKKLWVCPNCGFHIKIDASRYLQILSDENSFQEKDALLRSTDPLNFSDSKSYPERVKEAVKKTGLNSALLSGTCTISGIRVSLAIMDFRFIGGSMGSVVGEKVARAIERAIELKIPLLIVCASGGARMQEGILSLMQMAKTSALLSILSEKKLPYLTILTNPTTAGVMASYASLGDVIIAEPKALLGFAGPRVIKQTIGKELPENFQTSEFFREHGFIDIIAERKNLKVVVSQLLKYLYLPK